MHSLDELDHRIMELLQRDGRLPNVELARQLGVSEGTIRRRIDRLVNEGYIRIAAIVDPLKVGMNTVALIHLDVDLKHLDEAGAMLAAMPWVRVVAFVTGVDDIIIETVFPSTQELFRFLKDRLPKIPGVRNAETSLLLKLLKRSYEWLFPYQALADGCGDGDETISRREVGSPTE